MKLSKATIYHATIAVGAAIMLAGAGLRIAGIEHKITGQLFSGGLGMLTVSIIFLTIYKNPKKAKEYEIDSKDERSNQIRLIAFSFSWFVSFLSLSVAVVASTYQDNNLVFSLAVALWLIQLLSFFAAKAYYNKKM